MEWISVKERMPKASQNILVCADDRYAGPFIAVARMDEFYNAIMLDVGSDARYAWNATHRMPLPEPPHPKGEE